MSNLLNNAAKYTPRGGQVELLAEPAEEETPGVLIQVRDNGVGIAADMLPRVFDLFTQVGGTLDRAQGGLGIGLSIVKRLVEMHDGKLSAQSGGLGHGSTFSVWLPLAADAGRVAAEGPGPSAPMPARCLRVLVIDDTPDVAESLALMLEVQGHEVRTAHSGQAALAVARTFRPAVIFCDLGMPGMSGYEVVRRLREEEALRGALLVALTGWGDEEERRRSQAAGFDVHLAKPVDAAVIGEVLARARPTPTPPT